MDYSRPVQCQPRLARQASQNTSKHGAIWRLLFVRSSAAIPADTNTPRTTPLDALKAQGHTLAEMTVVIAILGIIAAIAVPSLVPDNREKLELAASLVADAIRYSQSEARRTGEAHGVTISQATQIVTVKKYNMTTDPVSTLSILTHPINKHPHKFNINTLSATKGVKISNASDAFKYKGLGNRRSLIFDAQGTPIWVVASGPTTYLLTTSDVELSLGSLQLHVLVAPYTGRVSIQ